MLGAMRWPWSSRTTTGVPESSDPDLFVWPELPDPPDSDEAIRKFYERTATRLFERGIGFLDKAANQSNADPTRALTELGRAYIEASNAVLTIGQRLGRMSQPAEPETAESN